MGMQIDKSRLESSKPYTRLRLVFPHIAKNLYQKWGTLDLDKYIDHLFKDTRGGTRKGFPPMAVEDLNLVRRFHDHLYGRFLREVSEEIEIKDVKRDIWGSAF